MVFAVSERSFSGVNTVNERGRGDVNPMTQSERLVNRRVSLADRESECDTGITARHQTRGTKGRAALREYRAITNIGDARSRMLGQRCIRPAGRRDQAGGESAQSGAQAYAELDLNQAEASGSMSALHGSQEARRRAQQAARGQQPQVQINSA
jgi:hypothetical protein